MVRIVEGLKIYLIEECKSTRPMALKTLKFEDFMSEDRIGGPARDRFSKLFKAQYDEAIKLGGINNKTFLQVF